jgi:hypothetical protein
MPAVKGCGVFAVSVSESESVIAYGDVSEMIVLHLHGGSHGVGGCGVCVCGGLHQVSLLSALCARGEVDHDHFGRWSFQLDCGMISVENCLGESSDGLRRVVLSSNSGRLEAYLVTGVRGSDLRATSRSAVGDGGGRRRTQPFLLLKWDCGEKKAWI